MEDFRKEIGFCTEVLQRGGLISYPTEMGWGIGCDATNEKAVEQLLNLLKPNDQKVIFCLVGNDAMLERHVAGVPEVAWDIMDLGTKPTGIVYDHPRGLAEELNHRDLTLAITVVKDPFCRNLINRFKKPLVYIPAYPSSDSGLSEDSEISEGVLKAMDYVVNLHRDRGGAVPYSIIALGNDGSVKVIRE